MNKAEQQKLQRLITAAQEVAALGRQVQARDRALVLKAEEMQNMWKEQADQEGERREKEKKLFAKLNSIKDKFQKLRKKQDAVTKKRQKIEKKESKS